MISLRRQLILEGIAEKARELTEALGFHTPLLPGAHVARSELEDLLRDLAELERLEGQPEA